MNGLRENQLIIMESACIQCEYEHMSKILSVEYTTSLCFTCIYNAKMIKTNNFIAKPKKLA